MRILTKINRYITYKILKYKEMHLKEIIRKTKYYCPICGKQEVYTDHIIIDMKEETPCICHSCKCVYMLSHLTNYDTQADKPAIDTVISQINESTSKVMHIQV